MSDVNLTDTEREALARYFDPLCFNPDFDHVARDRYQDTARKWADELLASDWLADHDRRVRAAALAPIQALAEEYQGKKSGGRSLVPVGVPVRRLRAALAAAGVDAAPNETTTEDECVCGHGTDRHYGWHGGCIECRCRAAVPSGHEQEGDHHGNA